MPGPYSMFYDKILFRRKPRFVWYSSKYMVIYSLQPKIWDECDAFAWNLGLEISLFLVNRYAVLDFWLLPVNILHVDYTCSASSSISLTCSLRCIITAVCIHAIVNWKKTYMFVQNKRLMSFYNKLFLSILPPPLTNHVIFIWCVQTWGQIHWKVFKYITVTFTDQWWQLQSL